MKTRIFVGSLLAALLTFSGVANAEPSQTRKPFDAAEFNRFVVDYPSASQWLTEKGQRYGGNTPWAMSGMRYDQSFIKFLQGKGWDADRFFYLLDHINMGLMTSQSEARQDAIKAQLEQQRTKMQARMAESQQKWQAQMQEQTRSSLETAQAQWKTQRERVIRDPNLSPAQKQNMLAQLDRVEPGTEAVNPEAQQARMRKQQQDWLVNQKKQVMSNPNIPPQQKQEIVANLDRSMSMLNAPQPQPQSQPQGGANVNGSPNAAPADRQAQMAERHAQMQAQQKQWIEARMKELRDNPTVPPPQKQRMLEQMQQNLTNLQQASAQPKEAAGPIPGQESALIKQNRQKLTEIFFPDM
ncbi:MAG: hypothetical protein HQL90_14390 [Magnetococcales bacterium]|nr:hypothetical protein [Magnetococcales bacterium]